MLNGLADTVASWHKLMSLPPFALTSNTAANMPNAGDVSQGTEEAASAVSLCTAIMLDFP